jgi:arsenate reductase (glutaredoxin)
VNPACSKCRAATAALDEAGIDYTVRRYLDDPPSRDELRAVLDRLAVEPWHVARTKEKVADEIGLASIPKDDSGRERWIDALVEHPVLIQRPIVTADDGTTVIGRDAGALGTVIAAEEASG